MGKVLMFLIGTLFLVVSCGRVEFHKGDSQIFSDGDPVMHQDFEDRIIEDAIIEPEDQCIVDCNNVEEPETPPLLQSTEVFKVVKDTRKVDILFITDNSSSMKEDQAKLASKFKEFTNSIQSTDWQMAFTTTDADSSKGSGFGGTLLPLEGGNGARILTDSTPNKKSIFANTVSQNAKSGGGINCDKPPYCGSNDEQPLKVMMLAMDRVRVYDYGFFRKDADLAIVVLTDEDEMSEGGSKYTQPTDVINKFAELFGETQKRLFVHGIAVIPGDKTCKKTQEYNGTLFGGQAEYADHLASLTNLTEGHLGSICDSSYAANARNIGSKIRDSTNRVILAHKPITDSIKVKINGEYSDKWSLDDTSLLITIGADFDLDIEVTYKYESESH